LAEITTTSASFTREKNPEDFKANVSIRYGKFSNQLLDAYPLADSTTPKTAEFINYEHWAILKKPTISRMLNWISLQKKIKKRNYILKFHKK